MTKLKAADDNNLVVKIANELAQKQWADSVVQLIESLKIHTTDINLDSKKKILETFSASIIQQMDTYEKTDPRYFACNILKCSVADRLMEIMKKDGDILKKMIADHNHKIRALKGKIHSDTIEHRIYNSWWIPLWYERQGLWEAVVVSRKDPDATKLADMLVSLSNGTITSRSGFSEVFFGRKSKRWELAGKKFIDKIFDNPDRLRFYAWYLRHAKAGFESPVQWKHEPLIDLNTLRKLFVKLLPRGENKKMNLKCVDNLIKQIPKEKKFVANKVVPTAESEDIWVVENKIASDQSNVQRLLPYDIDQKTGRRKDEIF